MEKKKLTETELAQLHKKQSLVQIWLPMILTSLVFLIPTILLFSSPREQFSVIYQWANISTIFLVLPILFITFVVVVMFLAAVYGNGLLIQVLPKKIRSLLRIFHIIENKTRILCDRSISPIINLRQKIERINTFIKIVSKPRQI
jgi:hypothetical protein